MLTSKKRPVNETSGVSGAIEGWMASFSNFTNYSA